MSKIDELKKQNPLLNVSLIDIIASADPTTTYKYLPFMIKLIKNELNEKFTIDDLAGIILDTECVDAIKKFEKHCSCQRIENNDITKYNNIDEIFKSVEEADKIVRQKENEGQVIKLYEDNQILILIPLTYEASKSYGSNTKWCITNYSYFTDYQWKHRIIFIIDKKDDTKKYAVSRKYIANNDIKGWTPEDKEISPWMIPFSDEVVMTVMKKIRKPQFEIEIEHLNDDKIYDSTGKVVKIADANLDELNYFLKGFKDYLKVQHYLLIQNKINSLNSTSQSIESKKKHEIDKTMVDMSKLMFLPTTSSNQTILPLYKTIYTFIDDNTN